MSITKNTEITAAIVRAIAALPQSEQAQIVSRMTEQQLTDFFRIGLKMF